MERTPARVIDRMEERGIVRRERDQHDRRIYRIWLTEEGKALREVLVPMVLELYDRTFHHVSPADRQHLSGLVDHMIANLCHPCASGLGETQPSN
jgi:MarR family transcriptional regulator, organic hydroperoxide resistance regulator